MIEHNYYQLMGLDPGVDASVVKKRYRELALLYHPDKNPNNKTAEEYFKVITQGYNILSEPDQKYYYDNMLMGYLERKDDDPAPAQTTYQTNKQSAAERIRMHKERLRESIIEEYVEAENTLPHKLRLILAILVYASGILMAYNNWFLNLLDMKVIYIILGSFLFGLGAYQIANIVYRQRVFKKAMSIQDIGPQKGPVRLFSFLFLVTPVLFLLFTSLTRTIHLKYFYDITIVDRLDQFREGVTYQYTVNGVEISRQAEEYPETTVNTILTGKMGYRVKFSRINPIISELITVEEANVLQSSK